MSNIKVDHQVVVRGHEAPVTTINQDVCCAMCEKVLVRTVQIKEIPQESYYKFNCPTCGGKSFIHNFAFKAFFDPVNCSIENIKKEGEVWLVQLKQK